MYLTFLRIIQRTPTCWRGELHSQQVVAYFSEVKLRDNSQRMSFASQPRYLQDAIIASAAFNSSYFTVLGGRREREKKKKKVGESFMRASET